VLLVDDRRHVELSANGAANDETTCSDTGAALPVAAFADDPLQATVGCTAGFTDARGAGRLDCVTLPGRLAAQGRAESIAFSGAQGGAASAFATAHYIMFFDVKGEIEYRFTGRLHAEGGESVAVLRRTGAGGVIFSREIPEGEEDLVFSIFGRLGRGRYRLELEGSARAAAADEAVVQAGAGFDALFLSAPGASCPADHDLDGTVDAGDLTGFITDFFATPRSHSCDINGDGLLNPDDLSEYIVIFFLGC
jgi:hypothetical protein